MPTHQDLPDEKPPVNYSTPGGSPAAFNSANFNVNDQNLLAAIAYFGFIFTGIFLLLSEKRNSYIRFHALQSILFSLSLIIVLSGVSYVALLPVIGSIVNMLIVPLVIFGAFGIWAVLALKAYQGQRYELPIIGPLANRHV